MVLKYTYQIQRIFKYIWAIDGTLAGTIPPDQSEPGSNDKKAMVFLQSPESLNSTNACSLVSNSGWHCWCRAGRGLSLCRGIIQTDWAVKLRMVLYPVNLFCLLHELVPKLWCNLIFYVYQPKYLQTRTQTVKIA